MGEATETERAALLYPRFNNKARSRDRSHPKRRPHSHPTSPPSLLRPAAASVAVFAPRPPRPLFPSSSLALSLSWRPECW